MPYKVERISQELAFVDSSCPVYCLSESLTHHSGNSSNQDPLDTPRQNPNIAVDPGREYRPK